MGIYPSDETLDELLRSCGKEGEEDEISFELFARTVALLLEDNADKVSTSSVNQQQEEQEYAEDGEAYYGEEQEPINLDDLTSEQRAYYE